VKEADLLEMLRTGRTHESSLIERKPDGFKDREARKTVVAFANSTPEGQEAVLFIGLHDKTGETLGVANPDELQRKYARVLVDCYPSITYQMHALAFHGKTVVAIVVPASTRKPHFTGGAYARKGSQSVLASDELYEELILSRTDKTRELLKFKNDHTLFSVRGINYHLGSRRRSRAADTPSRFRTAMSWIATPSACGSSVSIHRRISPRASNTSRYPSMMQRIGPCCWSLLLAANSVTTTGDSCLVPFPRR